MEVYECESSLYELRCASVGCVGEWPLEAPRLEAPRLEAPRFSRTCLDICACTSMVGFSVAEEPGWAEVCIGLPGEDTCYMKPL